jgi:hypothetical protein
LAAGVSGVTGVQELQNEQYGLDEWKKWVGALHLLQSSILPIFQSSIFCEVCGFGINGLALPEEMIFHSAAR